MYTIYAKNRGLFVFFGLMSFFSFNTFAQVGIGTVNPNGILDVQSTTQGVVLPRVALTDTYLMAPVTNPQTGIIPPGTVVYNTNITSHGAIAGVSDDVSKGIYVWNGTQWMPQFTRKQYALYEQSVMNIRTQSNEGYRTIDNLDNRTFTANYTGTYRIELNVNYGSGQATVLTGGDKGLNTALQSGLFRFSINGGTDYKYIPAGAYANAYKASGGGPNGRSEGNYFGIWKQYTLVYKVSLTKGDVLNLRLAFDQNDAPEFENNGNANNTDGSFNGGDGHVGFDIPCSIEISFMD